MPNLTEEDIKYRFISPAIENAGWLADRIAMEYFFTDGMITVQGMWFTEVKGKKQITCFSIKIIFHSL